MQDLAYFGTVIPYASRRGMHYHYNPEWVKDSIFVEEYRVSGDIIGEYGVKI